MLACAVWSSQFRKTIKCSIILGVIRLRSSLVARLQGMFVYEQCRNVRCTANRLALVSWKLHGAEQRLMPDHSAARADDSGACSGRWRLATSPPCVLCLEP